MSNQITNPYPIFTDKDGKPLDNGYVYIGTLNLNPETNPSACYWDSNLTLPAAQPIRTINGMPSRSGTPSTIFTADAYSITVRNSKHELVYYSPIGFPVSISSNNILFTQSGAGAITRTVQAKDRETVSSGDFAAAGDGVTNDDAEFAALEVAFTGRDIDLQGKTYLVTREPTQNNYFNGYFKRVSDGHIFKAGRPPEKLAYDERGALSVLKRSAVDARYTIEGGVDKAVVVLGDSISHGAFALNSYHNAWVNIFKRMMGAETGSKSYGFVPILSLGAGPTLTNDIHNVSFSAIRAIPVGAGWRGFVTDPVSGECDMLSGLFYESITPGDWIETSLVSFQRWFRIWYVQDPAGGTFSYSVNGGAATNVNTAGARNPNASVLVAVVDNGSGSTKLRIDNIAGTVVICGFGYEIPPAAGADNKSGNCVQNFSQSGRRLKTQSDAVIDTAAQGSVLILALGTNDDADVTADAGYRAAFNAKIDKVISSCLKYNTTLVVVDMLWSRSPSNLVRQQLRRAAIEARGIYVPLPDYLTRDQMVLTEYTTTDLLTNYLMFSSDGTHPTPSGHKWVAETVAKAMGLSCTSKVQAMAYYDYAWPLQFDAASYFKNQFTSPLNISTVQRVGDTAVFNINIITRTGAAIAIGSHQVNLATDSSANIYTPYAFKSIVDSNPTTVDLAGAVAVAITALTSGIVNVIARSAYIPTVQTTFSMQLTDIDRN